MDAPRLAARRMRFQISLATLFWITFSAACFLAGLKWDAISNSVLTAVSRNGTHIRLSTGKSTTNTLASQIPRALVDDPTVCRSVPITPTQLQVEALAKGTTSVFYGTSTVASHYLQCQCASLTAYKPAYQA